MCIDLKKTDENLEFREKCFRSSGLRQVVDALQLK